MEWQPLRHSTFYAFFATQLINKFLRRVFAGRLEPGVCAAEEE